MFTLRCTQKLLQRLPLQAEEWKDAEAQEPTTALGDWYAHLLLVERQHLVMLVSDRSRLCILTTARDPRRLPERFQETLVDLLRAIDISEEAIACECQEMRQMRYGPTTGTSNGRSVLGSINDYTKPLRYRGLEERSLFAWNVYLSHWMCGSLGYNINSGGILTICHATFL